jgi:predicted transcriptional regulator
MKRLPLFCARKINFMINKKKDSSSKTGAAKQRAKDGQPVSKTGINTGVKRDFAKMLFLSGETQKNIASRLEVSEATVSAWAKKDNWDIWRAGATVTRTELVNKTLRALDLILEQVLKSGDLDIIASLPDKLSKFASAIERLDKKSNIVSTMDSFRNFYIWLQKQADSYPEEITPDFMQKINRFQDLFVNENMTFRN